MGDCHRLAGKTALVTGAAHGIGAATAERLADEGATVLVADIDQAAGEQVAERIKAAGGTARFQHLDVTSATGWGQAASNLAEAGGLDILHSNAYLTHLAPAHQLTEQQWDDQLAVTLKAAWLGVRACHRMLVASRGNIVLTSSVHALVGLPGHPAYAAAKGALTSLGRQLAVEYGPAIRVNTVLPGPIMTRAWDRVDENGRAASVAATVARRFGAPSEVAAAVAFLASPDASFITGVSLVVDGGWSIVKESA